MRKCPKCQTMILILTIPAYDERKDEIVQAEWGQCSQCGYEVWEEKDERKKGANQDGGVENKSTEAR